jgi:hypothetical protein
MTTEEINTVDADDMSELLLFIRDNADDAREARRFVALVLRLDRACPSSVITRDDVYVREVQAVSELLMDFDPTDRFASISEHLADLLKRFAASRSAFSGIPRTENEPEKCPRCSRPVIVDLAAWMYDSDAELDDMCQCPPAIPSASPLSEEDRHRIAEIREKARTSRFSPADLEWAIDRLSASAPSPEDKGSET